MFNRGPDNELLCHKEYREEDFNPDQSETSDEPEYSDSAKEPSMKQQAQLKAISGSLSRGMRLVCRHGPKVMCRGGTDT